MKNIPEEVKEKVPERMEENSRTEEYTYIDILE